MPNIHPKPLKFRELIKKLKAFGVVPICSGKGSEVILGLEGRSNPYKGPQYPIKHHGDGTEISKAVINKAIARFKISPEKFWA